MTALLDSFALAVPGADFRLGWRQVAVGRLPMRPLVTGQVLKESRAGEDWEASLGFTVWLPRTAELESAETILDAMAQAAREGQDPPASVERGAASTDKNTGALTVGCTFRFGAVSQGGTSSAKKTYPMELDDAAYTVTGWKASVGGSAEELVSIGEEVPFARRGRTTYTVELQGLSPQGAALADGFTARLGGRTYELCRWKSLSATGGTFLSERMKEE